MRIVFKTLSYSAMHITIAVGLAYVLTRDWKIALGIGILEPVVQTLAFPLHEWLWERKKARLSLLHHHGTSAGSPRPTEGEITRGRSYR